MEAFQHERVVTVRGLRSGLPIIVAVHSTVLGMAAGGCRMWTYPTWRDALDDALRLSEAMTYKAALAGLRNGGGKTVIALPEGHVLSSERRRDVMLDLGDVVESLNGTYGVAEDVGTTAEDMLVVSERTRYAYCLPVSEGGSGEPSAPTAIGVYEGIKVTCAELFAESSVAGRLFTVIGLGQVGSRLATLLADAGAKLTVTDVDHTKRELAEGLGATWIEPTEALSHPTEIIVPAALGGLFTRTNVDTLNCLAIVGPANNQLATDDVADLLAERRILWAPDFVVNAGGVVYGALVDAAGRTEAEAMTQVHEIGATLTRVFKVAAESDITPAAAALRLAQAKIAAAQVTQQAVPV